MSDKTNYKSVMAVTCMATALVPLMGSALNLALPRINETFSLSATASGWIATSYILSTAILQIPCAKLADIVGRRTVFITGISLFIVFALLGGLSQSGTMLIICRALDGIGSAMIFSTNVAILTSAVPAAKRGWALGINAAVVYFSHAAGPFIGGFITEMFGWNGIFFFASSLGLCALIGVLTTIRGNWKSPENPKFDFKGTAIYGIGLFSLIYGFASLPHLRGIILTAAGILVLTLFALYEKRITFPILNVNLISRNRVFRHGILSALINYAATTSIGFMLSLYLQYIRGLSPTQAGSIMISQSLVMAFVSLMAGRMSDRIPPRKMAASGMAIVAVGLIALCFLTETISFWYIAAVLMVIGFGFGIFSSPNMNIIMSSVSNEQYGLASATTGTVRLIGQAFSMGLTMMVISLLVGNVQFSPEVHTQLLKSVRVAFMIGSALCLYGVYSSSVSNKKLDKLQTTSI